MTIKRKAFVAGMYGHPTRMTTHNLPQLYVEIAESAFADAELSFDDVDGYFRGATRRGSGRST